ncbi:MAG: T9SS type A sorting domain-containing protein [bacterium]|nr:T9SS type A sorting domain-containing protein [bacterium]
MQQYKKNISFSKSILFFWIWILFFETNIGDCTPYWTEEQILAQEAGNAFIDNIFPNRPYLPPEINPYQYYNQYLLTANWLRTLQVTTPGPDFGGMREGETGSLYTIIQTDNTQEAIVVWSNAKRIAQNDTLFQTEIARAWIYNRNWPAWLEEGGNNGYYRSHNAGWGLAATMAYIQATHDSSVIGYGDSCANYIRDYPVNWTSNVNRNAEGIAVGALAQYARWRNHSQSQRWLDTALVRGERLRQWIESNPTNILRQAESWALSGGCAFWGVLHSICVQNPTFGIPWVNQYGQFMEARPGAGTWANAWATWYGHAHTAAFTFTFNPIFRDSAITVTDYLLEQDVDNDGGIPATVGDPQNEDQSWVSCYMAWMLLDPLIPITSFPYDLAVSNISQPRGLLGVGDSIRCAFSIVNYGRNRMLPSILIRYGSSVSNLQTIQLTDTDSLLSGARRNYFRNLGIADAESLIIRVRIANVDSNNSNDSVELLRTVSPTFLIPVSITVDSTVQYPVRIRTRFQATIDTNYSREIDTLLSHHSFYSFIRVPTGNWQVKIETPPPFIRVLDTVNITANSSYSKFIPKARLWLLEDDSISNFSSYYTVVLDSIFPLYRHDNLDTISNIQSLITMFPNVLWFTGNRRNPFTNDHINAIHYALNQRTNVILSGQDVGETLQRTDSTLLQRFGATLRAFDTNIYRIYGIANTPLAGMNTLLTGSLGAGNQTSQDGFNVYGNGVAWSFYQGTSSVYSIVVTENWNFGKTVLTGFGLEAVHGSGINSRAFLISSFLNFFEQNTWNRELTSFIQPKSFQITLYPNPFNQQLNLYWNISQYPTVVKIYNSLGEIVHDICVPIPYTSFTWNTEGLSSGKYYIFVQQNQMQEIRPVILLK